VGFFILFFKETHVRMVKKQAMPGGLSGQAICQVVQETVHT